MRCGARCIYTGTTHAHTHIATLWKKHTHTQTKTQTHIHTNTYNVIDSECGRVCRGVSICGRVWQGVSMCGRVCSECVLERRPRVGRLLKAEASGSNADQLGRLVLPTVEYNNHTHWNAYFVFNLTTVFQPYCGMCSPPFDRIMYRLFSGISSKHFFDCRIYQPN